MNKLRIAMAGAGMISRHHLIAWAKCDTARVVALADPAKDRAQLRAGEFGVDGCYADVAEMLDEVRPDAIDIASPVATHVAIARLAAERGIAVLCQKPAAPTLNDAQELRDVAARVPFMVHENWRFRTPYRTARQWIGAGRIGTVQRFAISTQSSGLIATDGAIAPAIARQPFFTTMPRLMIFEVLIHHLDLARALCGELKVVSARTRTSTETIAGDDRAIILLEGADCIGTVTGDYATPALPPVAADKVEIIGDRGRIAFDGETLRLFDLTGELEATRYERGDVYQSAFDNAISHFVTELSQSAQFETSIEDNLKTFALVEDAYDAAESCGYSTDKASREGKDARCMSLS